jgi:hypothetical protein
VFLNGNLHPPLAALHSFARRLFFGLTAIVQNAGRIGDRRAE